MQSLEKCEAIFFPTKDGLLKIYTYGFKPTASWGEVYIIKGEQTICVQGFHRTKMVIRAVKMMKQGIVDKKIERSKT
ncbi:Uncharacterised protein [Listeria grayi]|uniref:Uncharacterized protein n=1 Tax=Listeria grayi TaxID=1641 RepID=A0A378MBN5_LISGR|nr:hypothetical protein [Listeria grayi]STY43741.1 Uncharacterised protein [Listeria grayi]